MDATPPFSRGRGRGARGGHDTNGRGRPQHKNKTWVANLASGSQEAPVNAHAGGDRWERGGHRGGRGRGADQPRSFPNASLVVQHQPQVFGTQANGGGGMHDEEEEYQEYDEGMGEEFVEEEEREEEEQEDELEDEPLAEINEPVLETQEEREKFYQELVKAREAERKKAIADGLMDDPLVPKRLEDAITLVGTCMNMAPRFERYRRERENNLFEWETIPGTKRVDHSRAVKLYERAAGDKTLPSDLRPPKVLKKTLDYLFHDLLPRGGFSPTFNYIRDRSRAVRNDFTMQHETGPLAIECHDRCARFHILALHEERNTKGFSIALEEQQLMNTLQSLKEFYEDQRGRYESPSELEMRVYHRLIHIRDQKERHEDIPPHIINNPVFTLTTKFRKHVQTKSAPIGKATNLVVDDEGMQIFGELAQVLREQGSLAMIYLVACILERLFGPDTIEDIESIKGDLTLPDIIDGVSNEYSEGYDDGEGAGVVPVTGPMAPNALKPGATERLDNNIGSVPTAPPTTNGAAASHFGATAAPSTFGSAPSVFGATPISTNPFASTSQPPRSAFSNLSEVPNAFGNISAFGGSQSKSVFGASSTSPANPFAPAPTAPSPFGSVSSHNFFGSSTGASSPFGSIPSSASAPAANGEGRAPLAQPNGTTTSTSAPSFAHGSLFGPSNGSTTAPPTFSSGSSLFEPPAQPPLTRLASEPILNPAAPAFTPTFKPAPSPLRQDSTDKVTGILNGISPAHPHPQAKRIPQLASSITWPVSQPPTMPQLTLTPPASLRINTNSGLPSPVPDNIQSPLSHPPSLNYNNVVSLPSTPTTSAPAASYPSPIAGPLGKNKSLVNMLKGSLHTGVSASSEILSPISLSSPTTSKFLQTFGNGAPSSASPLVGSSPTTSKFLHTFGNGTPSSSSPRKPAMDAMSSPLRLKSPVNGKGKDAEVSSPDREALASAFAAKGTAVKEFFGRWRARLAEKIAWEDACRRSTAYSEKIQRSRSSESPSERKRRLVSGAALDSSARKRARKRVSSEYKKPHTDEELAHRFKSNQEEHERRWANGSFLHEMRRHVKGIVGLPPIGWQIWLSMNPEMDATAIWLERKFDVPTSGRWLGETIFAMGLEPAEESEASPGVIVFERTPLEGVSDEIERKYRVLDDCSRLRDIVTAFPDKRHYVPCLFTITWIDSAHADAASDFDTMVEKFVKDGLLAGHQDFSMTSETVDLDRKLKSGLEALPLDVEGRLVDALSFSGVLKRFRHQWQEFSGEWLGACSTSGDLDWWLYAQLIEKAVNLLNDMGKVALQLVGSNASKVLPLFASGDPMTSDAMYDAALAWLDDQSFRDIRSNMLRELQSQRSMAREFPYVPFLEHLYDLAEHIARNNTGFDAKKIYYIKKTELASAVQALAITAASHAAMLERVFALHAHRSKRRPSISDSEISRFSTPSKRRRLSVNSASPTDDDEGLISDTPPCDSRKSPSPSVSASSAPPDSESPTVTVAMLRALTRDLKSKYGGSPLAKG